VGWGELAHARRAWLERLIDDQVMALVADRQPSLEVMMEFDLPAGIGAQVRARRDRQDVSGKGEGIVVGYGAEVLEAEDVLGPQPGGPG
jgi:hypothetical protein